MSRWARCWNTYTKYININLICRNTWVHVPGVYLNQLRHVEQGAEILHQARGERLGFWRAFETETAGIESCLAHTWVISHSYMSHVSLTHMSRVSLIRESCLTHMWVMSHSNTRVMSHSHMSHVSLTYESCLTHTHESCLTHTWVMSHSHVSHVSLTHMSHASLTHASCLTHIWVMSHSHIMSHVACVRVSHIWMKKSCPNKSHFIHMSQASVLSQYHSYMGHDSSIYDTRFTHIWDMPRSYEGYDSFICLRHPYCTQHHSYTGHD